MSARTITIVMLSAALAAGCASEPTQPPSFDSSLGKVEVVVAADGFVRCDGRRIPLEAAVLELRQRTRPMSAADLARFVIDVKVEPQPEGAESATATRLAMNRLVDELQIMGVRQVVYQ